MPYTLSPTDLLLSKLQIVELNAKDLDDCLRLLVTFAAGATPTIPTSSTCASSAALVGDDWGWWKTISLNLERIRAALADGSAPVPDGRPARPRRGGSDPV